jgi:uncharacterized protein
MNWSDLFAALALYLVLEGILYFLNPPWMKRMMLAFVSLPDNRLRTLGLISMTAGVVLLYVARA